MKPVKPELLIKKEILDFSHAPGLEPEEQTARHRFVTEAPLGPQGTGAINGRIPAVVEYSTQAGQLADAVQSNCGACKNHDRKAWRQYVSRMTGPASSAEDRQTIQTLRSRIMMNGVGVFVEDELDVEATLANYFGICQPLSEWTKGIVGENPIHWPVATTRDAACPSTITVEGRSMQIVTPAEPLGLFRPKDLDATKLSAARRDVVLFDAAGRPRL